MKRLLLLLFTLFTVLQVVAQPSNAARFFKAGMDFKNKGMFLEAIASFKRAIVFDKKFDSAYLEMGNVYVKVSKDDSAVAIYKKGLAVNPAMAPTHIALGNFYRDVKPNYDSALICYHAALKTDSLNKATYYGIAWCHNAKAESDQAIFYATKALEIDNSYKPAYSELGHAYNKSQKYKEGIEQFKKNLSISVVDLALLYSGLCYLALKDKEGATQQYEQLKSVNDKMATSLKKRIDALQ